MDKQQIVKMIGQWQKKAAEKWNRRTERSEARPTNTNSAEREPANGYGVMAARMLE